MNKREGARHQAPRDPSPERAESADPQVKMLAEGMSAAISRESVLSKLDQIQLEISQSIAQRAIYRWKLQKPFDLESDLINKQRLFRSYFHKQITNIFIMNHAALKIQHWYFKSKSKPYMPLRQRKNSFGSAQAAWQKIRDERQIPASSEAKQDSEPPPPPFRSRHEPSSNGAVVGRAMVEPTLVVNEGPFEVESPPEETKKYYELINKVDAKLEKLERKYIERNLNQPLTHDFKMDHSWEEEEEDDGEVAEEESENPTEEEEENEDFEEEEDPSDELEEEKQDSSQNDRSPHEHHFYFKQEEEREEQVQKKLEERRAWRDQILGITPYSKKPQYTSNGPEEEEETEGRYRIVKQPEKSGRKKSVSFRYPLEQVVSFDKKEPSRNVSRSNTPRRTRQMRNASAERSENGDQVDNSLLITNIKVLQRGNVTSDDEAPFKASLVNLQMQNKNYFSPPQGGQNHRQNQMSTQAPTEFGKPRNRAYNPIFEDSMLAQNTSGVAPDLNSHLSKLKKKFHPRKLHKEFEGSQPLSGFITFGKDGEQYFSPPKKHNFKHPGISDETVYASQQPDRREPLHSADYKFMSP